MITSKILIEWKCVNDKSYRGRSPPTSEMSFIKWHCLHNAAIRCSKRLSNVCTILSISTRPAFIEKFVSMSSAQLHNWQLNHVHRYIIVQSRALIGHTGAERFGNCTEIPYMVNHYTDPCKYLHFSCVTDMFELSFCYMFENLVVRPSDWGKTHRALKISFLMRSWPRSSSIFIIDIISFDQYFRSYREKSVQKT